MWMIPSFQTGSRRGNDISVKTSIYDDYVPLNSKTNIRIPNCVLHHPITYNPNNGLALRGEWKCLAMDDYWRFKILRDFTMNTEFDTYADSYYETHKSNIEITGETPEFFSEYKIRDLFEYCREKGVSTNNILDFGSGIGNSLQYFNNYFSKSTIYCADVSSKSLTISKERFPQNQAKYLLIGKEIPLEDESQDLVFSACVFHHIDHDHHIKWLKELYRVTSSNGRLVIFEHNPLNPLTVHAVNTCEFDVNAKLLRSSTMRKRAAQAGWSNIEIEFKLFFPSILKNLRPLEKYLTKCFLGAQWRLVATNVR